MFVQLLWIIYTISWDDPDSWLNMLTRDWTCFFLDCLDLIQKMPEISESFPQDAFCDVGRAWMFSSQFLLGWSYPWAQTWQWQRALHTLFDFLGCEPTRRVLHMLPDQETRIYKGKSSWTIVCFANRIGSLVFLEWSKPFVIQILSKEIPSIATKTTMIDSITINHRDPSLLAIIIKTHDRPSLPTRRGERTWSNITRWPSNIKGITNTDMFSSPKQPCCNRCNPVNSTVPIHLMNPKVQDFVVIFRNLMLWQASFCVSNISNLKLLMAVGVHLLTLALNLRIYMFVSVIVHEGGPT